MLILTHGRSRTLIGAVVSVAVPAAVMAVAVVGDLAGASHQSGVADSAQAVVGQAAAAARPSASVSPAAIPRAQATPGVRLLTAAATAGESTSYQGVEMIARWTMTGTSTVLSTVLHSSGGPTLTQTTDAAAPSAGQAQLSYDPYQALPEGVFGVTKPLVALLAAHYMTIVAGTGSVAGRAARIVEVRRADGGLAAKFWLDRGTGLPLRREDYADSELITEATFIQVKFGPDQAPAPTASATSAAASDLDWNGVGVPAVLVSELRTKGWPIPVVLPGGLALYAGAVSSEQNAVVDLSYSDGLYEVSLFVQKGILAAKLAGWQPSKIAGRLVFVSARGVTWSARGYVYTVLSDASPQVVTDAVAALPHDTPPGFWNRLGHGLTRLGHLVDPFR